MGCTCAGIISQNGPDESLKALAILAIKGPKEEFAVAVSSLEKYVDAYETGVRMAKDLKSKNPGVSMIHFLPSVLPMPPFDQAIAGIESVFSPDTPIFGGASVDNMKGINTYAFLNDQVIEKGWFAVGFSDPTLKIVTRANHGFDVLKGMQLGSYTIRVKYYL